MKRILLYIIIVGLSFTAPVKKMDVARLAPVEAVAIVKKENKIFVTTDTEEYGEGRDINEAFNDLVLNATSFVYLDTAKYLLITENLSNQLGELKAELKGSVKICLWYGEENVNDLIKYLTIHNDLPKLSQWNPGMKLPGLYCKKFQ